MFRYILLLLLLGTQVLAHNHLDLRNTREFNLTFYYEHDYPEPDCHQIYLFAMEEGEELKPLLQNISNTLASVQAVAVLYNATVDDLPEGHAQHEIDWTDKFVVHREIFVEIENEELLPDLVDSLNELRHRHGLYLGYIEEGHLEEVDEEAEEAVAREEAVKESAEICDEYFGMKLKEVVGFQRVGAEDEQTEEEKETEQEADDELDDSADLFAVVQQIEEEEERENTEWENAIFKVEIVCQQQKKVQVPPKNKKVKVDVEDKMEKSGKKEKKKSKSLKEKANQKKEVLEQ